MDNTFVSMACPPRLGGEIMWKKIRQFMVKHLWTTWIIGGIFAVCPLALFTAALAEGGLTWGGFLNACEIIYVFYGGIALVQGVLCAILPTIDGSKNLLRSAAIHYFMMIVASQVDKDKVLFALIAGAVLTIAFANGFAKEEKGD
jgi:hypothetical protein